MTARIRTIPTTWTVLFRAGHRIATTEPNLARVLRAFDCDPLPHLDPLEAAAWSQTPPESRAQPLYAGLAHGLNHGPPPRLLSPFTGPARPAISGGATDANRAGPGR